MEQSDEALVQQAVGLADTEAFEVLVRRHQPRVLLLQRRLARDPALAEDLCQETFLRAWRKLATYDRRGSFAGWLAALARNVFLRHLRRTRRTRENEVGQGEDEVPADTAEGAVATTPELLDLERLLGAVSEDEQILLVLNYAHGLSSAEIAEIVGSKEGTVKSQIHRAKEKIRKHFGIGSAAADANAG
jgi:RNA polymerase sigma-70 factor (ECF subfamily)